MKLKIKLRFFSTNERGIKVANDQLTEVEANFITNQEFPHKSGEVFMEYTFTHPLTGKLTTGRMTKLGYLSYLREQA